HDRVAGLLDHRVRNILDAHVVWTVDDRGAHAGILLAWLVETYASLTRTHIRLVRSTGAAHRLGPAPHSASGEPSADQASRFQPGGRLTWPGGGAADRAGGGGHRQ